jgi:hypothetical protein
MRSDPNEARLRELGRRFAWHAANAYRGRTLENSSLLYAHLSQAIAEDPALLALAIDADLQQQPSNQMLGAVHFLLLSGTAHPLVEFYRSLTNAPQPPQNAYTMFRDFCLAHAGAIRQIVATRGVQTNEVQRAACLAPAFALVAERAQQPLALVEIGASAGLHLLWDHYGYDYGSAGRLGDPAAPVQLRCLVVGARQPPVPAQFPRITSRIGIDLMPVDVHNDEAVRWLRALIWPEHIDRAEHFARAIATAREHPVPMIAGNAVNVLPGVLEHIPDDAALCIYHSYTLNQMPRDVREQLLRLIEGYDHRRTIYRVSMEWYAKQEQPQLALFTCQAGTVRHELLAFCESHGRHIEWL